MRKIKNPFLQIKEYQCFGCDPRNENGLHLEFYEEGEWIQASWKPVSYLEGYPHIVHGGIQATLLDEIGAWVMYVKAQTSGVTSRLNVKYKKAVYSNQGNLLVRAKLLDIKRQICIVHAELLNVANEICAEAEINYFLFSQELAKKEYLYPESLDAFFEDTNQD